MGLAVEAAIGAMSDIEAVAIWERMAGASSMVDVLAAQEGIDGEALIQDFAPWSVRLHRNGCSSW